MKHSILAIAITLLFASGALADPSCTSQASEKKLAGAALTSFMKKCERDAKAACTKTSQEKKLAGAAKTSFEKKCVEDATGKKT
jgi:psiF repeat